MVAAMNTVHLLGKVQVIGTDGMSDAYASIKAGELTGKVDSLPKLTGVIALEVHEPIVAGQDAKFRRRLGPLPYGAPPIENFEKISRSAGL